MNQRGEASLLGILCLVVLTSILTLSSMILKRDFSLLEKRTHLFLCVKETKGEMERYLKFMGRTNWGIKNINRASWILALIPGMQGAAVDAQKLKKLLVYSQDAALVPYLKTLKKLQEKSCPIDPRLLITPFQLGTSGHARDAEEAIILRENQWKYYFVNYPYALEVAINATSLESPNPRIHYQVREPGEKLSSLLISSY